MDYVLIDGDEVIFEPKFGEAGEATVVVQPVKLKASGPTTLSGKKLCVQGNETSVSVPNCSYSAKPYVGGTGTLTITSLKNEHVATKSRSGNKKLLLVGRTSTGSSVSFTARFEVVTPAKNSSGGDPTKEYFGSGFFETANTKFRAT